MSREVERKSKAARGQFIGARGRCGGVRRGRDRCAGDWPTCGRPPGDQEARFGELEVGRLTVNRLHVVEHRGSSS
jgi:hypothetical protein